MRSAIMLVFDRLSTGFLGPYGNTWVETPGLNRLAAESALFEFPLSDSPCLERTYRSYWSGWHAMSAPERVVGLAQQLEAAGVGTALITDAAELLQLPLAAGFGQRLKAAAAPAERPAPEINRTGTAQLLAETLTWLSRARGDFLLWVHARGMQGPWDAPLAMRNQFADEDDPLPPDFVAPPRRWLQPDEDPDLLLGIQHAYAGQVTLLDECLEAFLDACRDLPACDDALLVVTAPRGYPLGEHGRIGSVDGSIYGEHLHVPCLIRYPDQWQSLTRCQELVQPADVHATLQQWFSVPNASPPSWGQSLTSLLQGQGGADRAAAISDSCRALRTTQWFLHCRGDQLELFAKPDDRWEANEVSARCQHLLPQLQDVLDDFQRAARSGDRRQLAPLPDPQ